MSLKVGILGLLLVLCILAERSSAGPYFEDGESPDANEIDGVPVDTAEYSDNTLEDLLRMPQQKRLPYINVFRRGCIRRDGNCDHRPNDCCYSSSCRCNLWGSNCRCQRMGLFQKWG